MAFITPTSQDILSVPNPKVKPPKNECLTPCKMEPPGCPQMSVINYHFTLRKIPKRGQNSFPQRRKPESVYDVCHVNALCEFIFPADGCKLQ